MSAVSAPKLSVKRPFRDDDSDKDELLSDGPQAEKAAKHPRAMEGDQAEHSHLRLAGVIYGSGPWLEGDSVFELHARYLEDTVLVTVRRSKEQSWTGHTTSIIHMDLAIHVGSIWVSSTQSIVVLRTHNAIEKWKPKPRMLPGGIFRQGSFGRHGSVLLHFARNHCAEGEFSRFLDALDALDVDVKNIDKDPAAMFEVAGSVQSALEADNWKRTVDLIHVRITTSFDLLVSMLEAIAAHADTRPAVRKPAETLLDNVRLQLENLVAQKPETVAKQKEALAEALKTADRLRHTCEQLERARAQTAITTENLQRDLAKTQKKYADIKESLGETQACLHTTTAELNVARSRQEDAEKALEARRHDFDKQCHELADRRQDVKVLKDENQRARSLLAEREREITAIRTELQDLHLRHTSDKALLAERTRELEESREKKAQDEAAVKAAQSGNAALHSEISRLHDEIAQLRGKHAALYAEMSELASQNAMLHNEVREGQPRADVNVAQG